MARTKFAAITAAAVLALALTGGSHLASAAKKPKKPRVVGTDPAGDWAHHIDTRLSPIGDQLGQDLLEASIGMKDATTVNFIIKVGNLPHIGGMPEFTRYVWALEVDGEYAELDGKFTNYSRGTCDPTSGQCPPPRDPGSAPFLVRGDCTTNEANTTTCIEKGLVHGEFDADAGTITIPVSLELLGAQKKSVIKAGSSSFTSHANTGGPLVSIPSAFVSSTGSPNDVLQMTKTFKVPRK